MLYDTYKKIGKYINEGKLEQATAALQKLEDHKMRDFFNYSDSFTPEIFKFLNDTYKPLWKDYADRLQTTNDINNFLKFANNNNVDLDYKDEYGRPLYQALLSQINRATTRNISELQEFVALSKPELLKAALEISNIKDDLMPYDAGNYILNTFMNSANVISKENALQDITTILHDVYNKAQINAKQYESNYAIPHNILYVAFKDKSVDSIQKFFADNSDIISPATAHTIQSNYIVTQLFKEKTISKELYDFADQLFANDNFTPTFSGVETFVAMNLRGGHAYSELMKAPDSLGKALTMRILQSNTLPINGFKAPFDNSEDTAFERLLVDGMNGAFYRSYLTTKNSIDAQSMTYDDRQKAYTAISQSDVNAYLIPELHAVFKELHQLAGLGMNPGLKMHTSEELQQMFNEYFDGTSLKRFNRDIENVVISTPSSEENILRQHFDLLIHQAAPQATRKAKP